MLVAGLAAWVVFQLHILLEFGVDGQRSDRRRSGKGGHAAQHPTQWA